MRTHARAEAAPQPQSTTPANNPCQQHFTATCLAESRAGTLSDELFITLRGDIGLWKRLARHLFICCSLRSLPSRGSADQCVFETAQAMDKPVRIRIPFCASCKDFADVIQRLRDLQMTDVTSTAKISADHTCGGLAADVVSCSRKETYCLARANIFPVI